MNFGDINGLLKGRPLLEPKPNSQSQTGKAPTNLSGFNHNSAIVERSQTTVLSFSVLNKVVGDKLAKLDPNGQTAFMMQKSNESLFDFEEVANNVLSFVEKAVMKAKGEGANDGKLTEMLDQARKGIDEGFSQARQELADMGHEENEEINTGIDKSYDLIQEGLERFETSLFGPKNPDDPQDVQALGYMSAVNYSLHKSSSLAIKTNDGDTVTIDFAEALAYQRQEVGGVAQDNSDGKGTMLGFTEVQESRYHATGFSFSIEGELDEEEKAAIGELVKNVSELADEFFNGDLDKAFEQATQLGFDENELSGFALNMRRTEKISVAQAYTQVAGYQPTEHAGSEPESYPSKNMQQLMRPVADYFNDLMDFLEQAREQLQDEGSLQSLIDGSASKYLAFRDQEVSGLQLDRFTAFNQHLLNLSGLDNQADG